MKLIVKYKKRTIFVLIFPLSFLKYAIKLSEEDKEKEILRELVRELKKFKKAHRRYVLLEANSRDGTYVKITL